MGGSDFRDGGMPGGQSERLCRAALSSADALCKGMHRATDYHFFLLHDQVYNRNTGFFSLEDLAPEGDVYELVCFIAEVLAGTLRKPETGAIPNGFEPRLLVTCENFETHRTADGEGVVVDSWRGEVWRASKPEAGLPEFALIDTYSNARDLAELLEANGVFSS